MHTALRYLTDCGDTAVTVPLAMLMFGFLLLTGQRGLALGWALVFVACVATISALKLALSVCGPVMLGTPLRSPSGHTAISLVVYGGYGMLIGAPWRPLARHAAVALAIAFAVAIGVSRVVLHFHSSSEVAVGLLIGGAFLTGLVAIVAWRPPAPLPLAWLAATAILAFLAFYGERWPAEQTLHRFAALLDMLRPFCT